MWDIPLNALRAFALVFETGGVRSAAHQLRVSHSSVSRHIRELEAWLGLPLIETAGSRAMVFTPQGRELGKTAAENLTSMAATVLALREARRPNAVVLSTTASVAARWLLPRLPALQQQLPAVEISVLTEQAVADPDGRNVDFALRMGSGPWPDVDATHLMDEELFPVIHPRLMDTGMRDNPKLLFSRLPLLHDRDPAAAWERWFDKFPANGVDLRGGSRFASSDLVLRAAAQGLGVALARRRLATDDIASGALVCPFGEASVHLTTAYWIVRPRHVARRQAVESVVSWLLEQAK